MKKSSLSNKNQAGLGGTERSEVPPNPALAAADPEVPERPVRRQFDREYKLRILHEADHCPPGELGALLRREGLYSSHLATWRRQRAQGILEALAPKKRGPKAHQPDPLLEKLQQLQRDNQLLQARLQQAQAIIDVQKKISEIWALNPCSAPNERSNS